MTMLTKQTPPPEGLASQSGSQIVVWWLTEDDYAGYCPRQESNPLKMADYIYTEFCSLYGRAGRARLWVPMEIKIDRMTADPDDPRFDNYIHAGGIVIYAKDAPECALWGGRFTDLALNVVNFANV